VNRYNFVTISSWIWAENMVGCGLLFFDVVKIKEKRSSTPSSGRLRILKVRPQPLCNYVVAFFLRPKWPLLFRGSSGTGSMMMSSSRATCMSSFSPYMELLVPLMVM
jgi:hypothetical protein